MGEKYAHRENWPFPNIPDRRVLHTLCFCFLYQSEATPYTRARLTEMEYLWWWRKSFRKLPGSRGPGEWQMGQTSGICSPTQPHSHSRFFPCGRIASAEILSKFKLFESELKSMDIKGKIHESKLGHRQRPQPPSWDLLGEQCIRIWEKPFSVGRSTYKTHGLAVDEARNKSSVS